LEIKMREQRILCCKRRRGGGGQRWNRCIKDGTKGEAREKGRKKG
jgi:hypothetical protein